MFLLYDNIVVLAISLVACAYTWLYGGIVADALPPVMPWLTVLLWEVMFCFPQRHQFESTYDARERVWEALKKDPMTWICVGFTALLMLPFINVGLCPTCDYALIQTQGLDPAPPAPYLPYCVNRWQHLNVVMWFVPALTALLAVKHSLAKRGKRLLLELIVWNGVALSVVGALQQITGAQGPLWQTFEGQAAYFFSTFGYPNMGGDYFTTLFGISIGLWRWKWEIAREQLQAKEGDSIQKHRYRSWGRKHYMLIPAIIFFFSALMTLSRAAIILVSFLAIIFFLHTFACVFVRLPKAKRVKASAASLLGLVLIGLTMFMFLPSDVQKEVGTLDTFEVLDRVTGRGQYHARVATEIWKENVLFGCGGWGYKHFCLTKMTPEELKHLQTVGGINVHNDYLQFLAEHGLVGFGCLVSLVVILLWPLGRMWKALMGSIRFIKPKDQPPHPHAIFVIPAPVFCILMVTLATLVHAFADCPLRSPAVLTLFFVALAAMDGFLPKLKTTTHD